MSCHKCHKPLEASTCIRDAAQTEWCIDCAAEGLRGLPVGTRACSKPGCAEPLGDVSDRIDFGAPPNGQAWHKGCAAMELARL